MEPRWCPRCVSFLPLEEFNWRLGENGKKYPQSYCKRCASTYQMGIKQARGLRQSARRKRLMAISDEAKSRPCLDCGVQYPPYIMDFDHRNPAEKVACVSKLVGSGAKDAEEILRLEIEKCDVVCSNCHRERTWGGPRSAT